jgi:type VI secretion system protein
MALQLTIIKFPPGVSLVEDRKTFGSQGGVIGRGVDNDWVLSDPERFLSSKHCQVARDGERYFLIDLSTNGTFVNGSPEPLGRGSRTALNDGDSFDVGEYRFKVVLLREAGLPDADPFAASTFGSSGSFGSDPFGLGSAMTPESAFMSGDYQGSVQDITPDSLKITDPLLALDNANRGQASRNVHNDPFALTGSREDSANLMSEAIAWPESKQESGLLPEDWADDLSLIGARKSPTPKYPLPDDDALIQEPARDKRDSLLDSDPFRKPGPNPHATGGLPPSGMPPSGLSPSGLPPKGRVPAQRETLPPKPIAQGKPAPGGKQVPHREVSKLQTGPQTGARAATPPVKAPPPTARVSPPGALDRTLVDAMGLTEVELSDDQIREIHATVGAMMRETIDGLMQVLRSRTSIKNEFRINITTIQPVENNPIKFSASVDEVLELMFLRRSRAYKAPLDAIEESFDAIADHQLAVIAGIRSAFRSVLSKFDPERLEEEFKQTGKGGLLPGMMKGRFWGAYQEHYQKVINDMERSFQELFGDEFVQAYEDQMRKLSQARKHDL